MIEVAPTSIRYRRRKGTRTHHPSVSRGRRDTPSSPSHLPTLVLAHCQPWFVGFMTYALGKPPEGELHKGKGHEGGRGYGNVLEVLGQMPVWSEPGEGLGL